MITKPMLAGKCTDPRALRFPVLATPKLDGIRCLKIEGKAISRKFKPIPNKYIRSTIELGAPNLSDGEIVIPGRTFNELSGDVRREEGRPTDFQFMVFDLLDISNASPRSEPYSERMARLKDTALPPFCQKVLPLSIPDIAALEAFEAECLSKGFEGVMVRSPNSPYKCGRSTESEGYLLKIKRFDDAEAVVIGFEEEMQNLNVATRDAFGRTERSSHKENLVGKGRLGKLICRLPNGIEFGIGTGFTAWDRQHLWEKRKQMIGQLVKFKHQPSGADERPRFPVFLGFRDKWDL